MPVWGWVLVGCGGMGCLTIPIMAAILFPVFAVAREKARSATCMSNEKQIGLAMLAYATDNDGSLPAGSVWMKKTDPYVAGSDANRTSGSVFHCPSDDSPYGYAFNSAAASKNIAEMPDPDKTVAVYDSTAGQPNATDKMTSLPKPGRHRNGNNIGYADGHVKHVLDTTGFAVAGD